MQKNKFFFQRESVKKEYNEVSFLSVDPLEEMFRDPDRRAKLYLVIVGGMILSTILITVGTLVFILRLLGVI